MPSLLLVAKGVQQLGCQRVDEEQIPFSAHRGAVLFDHEPQYSCWFWVHLSPSESSDFWFSSFLQPQLSVFEDTIWKITFSTRCPDQWLRVCISFHLFNSLDACRHWTRCLLAYAMPSVHPCSSIFMLAFQPITFGCPILYASVMLRHPSD